ncbi:MAG: hypothetical protein ACYCYA_01255 [Actinomycetes bacterium]
MSARTKPNRRANPAARSVTTIDTRLTTENNTPSSPVPTPYRRANQ